MRDPLSKNSLATIQSWEMALAETIHTFLFLRYDIGVLAAGKESKEIAFLTAKGIMPNSILWTKMVKFCKRSLQILTTFVHILKNKLHILLYQP